ncbi:helix-turn-helix domain-containing protein [Paenibacillus ferrarius]|uniref:helix-turn-helix domain-containing protein n=1 Tax=Paenibacillus ferrarius TaxID=1469647 RepID=UPI003D2E09DF
MSFFTRPKSLFRTILTSFLTLILIFSCFNLLIFGLLKRHLRSEMIEQNRLTLQKVADRYQMQLDRVKEALYKEFTDKDVITFNNQVSLQKDADTLNSRPVVQDIQSLTSDSELYLDTMFLLFRTADLAVNKMGSGPAAALFTDYTNAAYPLSYWQAQFDRRENFVLHAAASFGSPGKTLIPYSIKPALSDNMLIAMVDADGLRDAILRDHPGLQLTLLGADSSLLYRTSSDTGELPKQVQAGTIAQSDYLFVNGVYYLSYGIEDGMRVILAVSSPDLAAKLLRLDNLMMILLGVSILIALWAAISFSKRINKPVRELLKEKTEIQQTLQDQQSLLTNYHYITRLKNISHDAPDWPPISTEETFTVVLYELRFRSAAFVQTPVSHDQTSLLIGEQIKPLMEANFPASHTFQMEHHQFLTVFPGGERERILATLATLKAALDRDLRFGLVTIAVSSAFEHSVQFGHAYRQVQDMAQQARLAEETQIVTEFRPHLTAYTLTLAQEKDLTTALMSGKEQDTLDIFLPWLEELARYEASIDMFKQLTQAVTAKAQKVLEHYKIQPDIAWQLKPLTLQLDECCTVAEYRQSFASYFTVVASIVREKKDTSDPVIDHVLSVVQERYADDLSLDTLADQLNLSTSYLSTYIKEKTGVNFMEHLHERRVRNAQELLQNTDLNIQEIGVQVGYRNISSFNRMFKNRTGTSPGEYRRMHRTS